MVRGQIGTKTNWTDSDDLAMMFHGTYQPPFYRALAAALHHEIDLRHEMTASNGSGAELLGRRLASLIDKWTEVGRLEASERSARPTELPRANATHLS